MQWQARLFDGRSSSASPVTVALDGETLQVRRELTEASESAIQNLKLDTLTIGERFIGAPRMIALASGETLQVEDDAVGTFDRALAASGVRSRWVDTLIQSWRNVVICAISLVAFIVWFDRQGAGLLASAALQVVPITVDQKIGRAAFPVIEAQMLAPSKLDSDLQQELFDRFADIMNEQYADMEWQLEFRTAQDDADAVNAFALPDGTIVLFDGLVNAMTDDEVMAVLAHEVGHVVHRHSMKGIARSVGLFAVAGVVWGDISTVASTTAASLPALSFGREAEREADAFAHDFLVRAGISRQALVGAFDVLQKETEKHGDIPAFLSSHPPTEERLRKAQEAAQSQN